MKRHRKACLIIAACLTLLCVFGLRIIYPDTSALKNAPLDDLQLIAHQEAGAVISSCHLQLSDDDKARLRSWLRTLDWLSFTPATYVPGLELRSDVFNINFYDNGVVINYKLSPGSDWTQVHRSATEADRQITHLLRSKLPAAPGEPISTSPYKEPLPR